jgi:hypothetical protein
VGTIQAGAVGVNTPIWNQHLLDPSVPALLRQAGVQTLVFNGGGVSDLYHWQTATLSPDPDPRTHPYDYAAAYLKPKIGFDQFAGVARRIGAHMLVHVNYGTGTPAEAAAWVRHANVVQHDGVRDWEVGEEVYLNGGAIAVLNVEPDAHADKSAAAYAQHVLAYARAMKAVDPTIHVGVGLYPIAQRGNPLWAWDQTVLRIAGRAIDFVDLHWYPLAGQANNSDKAVLASVGQIPATLRAMRALVSQYAGPSTHRVQLIVGETNSAVASAPQQVSLVNALYLANTSLTLLEQGATGVDWWALHNGWSGTDRGGYGDLGLLSSGNCVAGANICAPPADTPFAPYYGMQLLGTIAQAGGDLLSAASSNPLIAVHAVRRPDGTLAVLLINQDPSSAHAVHLALTGYRPGAGALVLGYGKVSTGITRRRQDVPVTGIETVPPYSLTALILHPAGHAS